MAQRAAHTIIRMTQLLTDVKGDDPKKMAHDIARMTNVKEEHANILEEELETLSNDYFKEEHFKTYPNLNDLFIKTLNAVSKARQEINMEAAKKFWLMSKISPKSFLKPKMLNPVRVKSVYPTGGEIVLHK